MTSGKMKDRWRKDRKKDKRYIYNRREEDGIEKQTELFKKIDMLSDNKA